MARPAEHSTADDSALTQMLKEWPGVKSEIGTLKASNATLQDRMNELRADVETRDEQLKACRDQIARLEKRVQDRDARYEEPLKETTMLRTNMTQDEQQSRTREARILELEAENVGLTEELPGLRSRVRDGDGAQGELRVSVAPSMYGGSGTLLTFSRLRRCGKAE